MVSIATHLLARRLSFPKVELADVIVAAAAAAAAHAVGSIFIV